MKKIIPFLFIIFSISLSAQKISGKAYYKSNTNTGRDYSEMPEEKRLRLEKRDKELYEKTYILTFNNKESIFKEEETLKDPRTSAYMMGVFSAMRSYITKSIFKNLETRRIMEEREFLGKKFLIDDTLTNIDWQLEKESKQIGEHIVFKATATIKVDLNDYRTQVSIRKNSLEQQQKGIFIVTAWYTPQIPVSNGPDEYSGLPGLIMELNVGRTTFLCSKIILYNENKVNINPPKKGEVVTYEKFEKIVAHKKEELEKNSE